MKTDRELLELAAKAAGYAVDCGFDDCPLIYGSDAGPDGPREWNPLTDDGDALRLAVKLKLNFTTGELACAASWPPHTAWVNEVIEAHEGSRQATTRRAIVRAAAAIGESMHD